MRNAHYCHLLEKYVYSLVSFKKNIPLIQNDV